MCLEPNPNLVFHSKLNGSPFHWSTARAVVRVPLKPHIRSAAPKLLLLCSSHGLGEDVVETFSLNPHGKDPLLILLGCPSTSEHHPEEVGFDP